MNKNLKTYFSIKEVAQQLDVAESTLRYWQKEFPQLKPKTSDSGVRMYTEKDIEVLKVRGFKIASARKMLHTNREGADKQKEVLDCLMRVRDDLKRLKAQLDGLV